MSNVTQAREALGRLKEGLIRITGECMQEHSQEITGLLVHQQFEESEDSQGNPLRQYTDTTRKIKQYHGLYTGKTDFHNTGQFQGEFVLRVDHTADTYEIESPAMTEQGELKSAWLMRWQGAPIMDLTPDNVKLIFPIIKETFEQRVNDELPHD